MEMPLSSNNTINRLSFRWPGEFFPDDVLDGLLAAIAVGFEGEEDQARDAAVAADGLVHALRLDRERATVVVRFAVDEEDRRLDLVGVHKRRHLQVDIGRLPQGPPLALKSERCECAVGRAALGDAGLEQVAVRQQSVGHEGAVAVAAYADARAVRDT